MSDTGQVVDSVYRIANKFPLEQEWCVGLTICDGQIPPLHPRVANCAFRDGVGVRDLDLVCGKGCTML